MKKFLYTIIGCLCFAPMAVAVAAPMLVPAVRSLGYPAPLSRHVNDFASLMAATDVGRVQDFLLGVKRDYGVEIIVVTIGSMKDYVGMPQHINAFATDLFNHFGVGSRRASKGILLLVVRDDRKVRIELGAGYRRSYDKAAAKIINTILVPAFREGNFSKGIVDGVREIAIKIAVVDWYWCTGSAFLFVVMWIGIFAYDYRRKGHFCIRGRGLCASCGKGGWSSRGGRSSGSGGGRSSGGGASGGW